MIPVQGLTGTNKHFERLPCPSACALTRWCTKTETEKYNAISCVITQSQAGLEGLVGQIQPAGHQLMITTVSKIFLISVMMGSCEPELVVSCPTCRLEKQEIKALSFWLVDSLLYLPHV